MDIQVATTDKNLADSLSHAFHGLTGAAYRSNKGGELFIVGGWANEKVGKEGVITSLKAGVDTIEHGSEFDDECAKLMKDKDRILTPNIYIQTAVLEAPIIRDRYTESVKKRLEKGYYDSIRFAMERGVRIASGSDFSGGDTLMGLSMGKNAAELGGLVKAGLTPLQAIVAATKTASEAMMMGDKTGTLEAGKLADVVVVNGDPLDDITMLMEETRIGMVIKGGEIVVSRP